MSDLKLFITHDYRIDKNTPVNLMGDKSNHYLSILTNGGYVDYLDQQYPDTTSIFGIDLSASRTGGTGNTGESGSTGGTGNSGGTGSPS